MSRPPRLHHPAVDPACSRCNGRGFQIDRDGEKATARLCVCASSRRCPRCDGTRWVRREGRRGPVSRCDCHRFEQRLALFERAGLPGRLAHCTFDDYRITSPAEQAEPFGIARSLAAGFRPGAINRGFVLWGPVGRGKTHLLASTLRELVLVHGVRARFVEFSHLLSALKGRFDRGTGAAEILDQLVEVEVLALDELGKGRLTEWELSVIDELVSRRYNAARTILATTNYRPGPPTGIARPNLADPRPDMQPSLSDRVGERVFSRLAEMCEIRYLGGKDWRREPGTRW